jgi:hypothetical protein
MPTGCLVIRMHLNGEIPTGVNELDQQGELITETCVVILSHETTFLLSYQLIQRLTVVRTAIDNGLVVLDTGDFPTLAYILHLEIEVLESDNLTAAP